MECQKRCAKCSVKNGQIRGKQRYKCKECGFQYVLEHNKRGVGIKIRALAVKLCAYGMSFRGIADFQQVSHTTVMVWFRDFAERTYERPAVSGSVIIELDEMWHFCGKRTKGLDPESLLPNYSSTCRLGM